MTTQVAQTLLKIHQLERHTFFLVPDSSIFEWNILCSNTVSKSGLHALHDQEGTQVKETAPCADAFGPHQPAPITIPSSMHLSHYFMGPLICHQHSPT